LSYSTAQQRIEVNTEVRVELNTRLFGKLEFDESIVYHFPNGLPGFEELHKFIVINDKDTEPLKWLLSVNELSIGFPILEIGQIDPELSSEIPEGELKFSTALVIVTLNRAPDPMTVNLKAPIILNNDTKTGKQIILNSDKYSSKHKIN